MFNLFKSRQQSILGVDVSSTSVKILEISGNTDNYHVQAYASGLLPPMAIENDTIKDPEAVSATIKQLINQGGFTTDLAVIAMPDATVITKVLTMNKGLSDEEIEELVLIEADKFIPYAIDEVSIDFVVMGPSIKNPDILDVLVIASRTENLENRVEILTNAGLDVKIVDVESYAVERAAHLLAHELPAHGLDKIIAIIDLGSVSSHLTVLHGMKMIFTREEEFGGRQLIESMVEHYGISFEKALKIRQNGELLEGFEENLGKPFKEAVLLQVKRILQFFYSTSHYGFVDHVLLAGGVAREEGLVELLQKGIGIPVTLANPFLQMNIKKTVNTEQLYREAPSLMVACGLAMRRDI